MATNQALPARRRERNDGIEVLRLLSMFMIAVLHTLNRGGALSAAAGKPVYYEVAWFLEIGAYCCVDCYALISGYVGVGAKFRFSRLLALWLQTSFYCLGITAIFGVFNLGTVEPSAIIGAIFPILYKQYWYMSAYFGMFFFIPLMNFVVTRMPRPQLRACLLAIAVFLITLPSVLPGFKEQSVYRPWDLNVFSLDDGYSMIWLCICYLFGAYIRQYDLVRRIRRRWAALTYLGAVGFTWLVHYLKFQTLVSYISPTIFLSALALLAFWAGTPVRSARCKRIIRFVSPTTLGIYLLHVHPLIWNAYIRGMASSFASGGVVLFVLKIILCACAICLVGAAVDLLRIGLFSLCKVKERLANVDVWLGRLLKTDSDTISV